MATVVRGGLAGVDEATIGRIDRLRLIFTCCHPALALPQITK
jgi:predicted RNA polymerase sigma factor